jgi:PAP2 superfamily
MMKAKGGLIFSLVAVCAMCFLYYYFNNKSLAPKQDNDKKLATEVLLNWNKMILILERNTIGYRAPVCARMYGYMGLTAYEASLPFMKDYASYSSFNMAYRDVIAPSNTYLPQVINSSMASICKLFFRTAPKQFLNDLETLEKNYNDTFEKSQSKEAIENAKAFGVAIAESVWQFSKSDSIGHDGFLHNYDPDFKIDEGINKWKTNPTNNLPPLLPHWGKVRPFIIQTSDYTAKSPHVFDSIVGSDFYTQGMEVLSANGSYTKEQVWVAEFWSDDFPQLTMSPAGRWISILNQIIDIEKPSYEKAVQSYFLLGLALSDAATVCWYNKYKYQLLRPETYIKRYLSPHWQPLHDAPNFPSYPSGHSIFGAVSAEVLTKIYGNPYSFTDNTHKGREEFIGNPRQFNSFHEMAKENAYSRILMGVHFRYDCTEGLKLGTEIGKVIANLELKKKEKSPQNFDDKK